MTHSAGAKCVRPFLGSCCGDSAKKSPLGLVSDGWLIKTRTGALVSAPADGRVEFADDFRKNGRVIILSHKKFLLFGIDGIGQLGCIGWSGSVGGRADWSHARRSCGNVFGTASRDQSG